MRSRRVFIFGSKPSARARRVAGPLPLTGRRFVNELQFFVRCDVIALVGDYAYDRSAWCLLRLVHQKSKFKLAVCPRLATLGEKAAGKIFIIATITQTLHRMDFSDP